MLQCKNTYSRTELNKIKYKYKSSKKIWAIQLNQEMLQCTDTYRIHIVEQSWTPTTPKSAREVVIYLACSSNVFFLSFLAFQRPCPHPTNWIFSKLFSKLGVKAASANWCLFNANWSLLSANRSLFSAKWSLGVLTGVFSRYVKYVVINLRETYELWLGLWK